MRKCPIYTLLQAVMAQEKQPHQGGHNIEPSVIERRYHAGLKNLKELYIPKCDDWMIFDNSTTLQIVAQGNFDTAIEIYNSKIWNIINENG